MGRSEYAPAISIILFIGIPRIGELADLDHEHLIVQSSFGPTSPGRATFFIRFWELPAEWIFLSIVPGAIITILFYFDHEISTIICTLNRYGVRKPGGYACDIVLLDTTTVLCGILGVPPATGLLPQAPLHSESLQHWVEEETPPNPDNPDEPRHTQLVPRVREQRYSPFLQAAMIFLFVCPPFQWLLGLMPTSVRAGLFMIMGYQSLSVNPVLARILNMLTSTSELSGLSPKVQWMAIDAYTLTQTILTGIIFYVTLTVAAPAFPIIIIVRIPIRLLLMNRIWNRETLMWVDGWACREGKPEDLEDESSQEAMDVTRALNGARSGDEEKGVRDKTV